MTLKHPLHRAHSLRAQYKFLFSRQVHNTLWPTQLFFLLMRGRFVGVFIPTWKG